MRFEPLTPLTSDTDEWVLVDEDEFEHLWQNKRRSTSFSRDAGVTWYDIHDAERNNGEVEALWPTIGSASLMTRGEFRERAERVRESLHGHDEVGVQQIREILARVEKKWPRLTEAMAAGKVQEYLDRMG